MNSLNYPQLSKEVSYALRHAPWEFELELDAEGWVAVEQLLHSLRHQAQWTSISEADLATMIDQSEKKRHELADGKIRALYGHSVPAKIIKNIERPPAVVYHGTARHLLETILAAGLKPMGRQYVHLAVDQETAITVGKRKDSEPALLAVDAQKAWQDGIRFYRGNHSIWLADQVPPIYITVLRP
ncbi:phosphotransferase KptA/Tpt1 [Paenibacillus curdlanolyticus YK9]|uniref:Probable RNA 2'-phosphotransferase n=1 Tax=Paenibacillus curdlanolyticus YK9 TaxID=717606 RepID=E0I7Z7_9BACL|nr:RNA 2'-phosphotransferase [Paenibacillus curdlanolyticus]EFM11302.1 phosphotransferase KptA/Tpt1 [Paenibacillus curdlanolyticus YK9]